VLCSEAPEPMAHLQAMRTHDKDEAKSVVSNTYVPHQLRAGSALDARLNVIRSQRLTFGYLTYGAQAELHVPPMVDVYHVNLTLRGATSVDHGARSVDTAALRSGVVLSPTDYSTVRWSRDAAQFAIKIPAEALEAHLAALLNDSLTGRLRFSLAVDLRSPSGATLLNAARFLANQVNVDTSSDLIVRQLESYLLTHVLLGVPNSYSARLGEPAGAIPRAKLDEAIDYVESFPQGTLTAVELAAAVGVAAAALDAAFLDELDVSAAEYIQMVRLSRARFEVRAGDLRYGSLDDIARRWGFSRLDRFLASYERQFGERPGLA